MNHFDMRGWTMWPLWTLRVTALLHAGVLTSQPVLAGLYLDGELGALSAHEANAGAILGLVTLQLVVAALYCIIGRGRLWPLGISLVLLIAETAQWAVGYDHALHIHLPLGVSIVTGQLIFAVWSWRAGSRRTRTWRLPWEREDTAQLASANI